MVSKVNRGLRVAVAVAATSLLTVLCPTQSRAQSTTPPEIAAERGRDVPYSASSTDRNGWSANAYGDIHFYDGFRHFKIFGTLEVERGGFSSDYGYIAVRQNIANTTHDGRWYRIGLGGIGLDRYLDWDTTVDGVSYFLVGTNGSGEYFSWPTSSGRGLKGVWVRTCHNVDGPDVCGRKVYIDNPYVAGTRP